MLSINVRSFISPPRFSCERSEFEKLVTLLSLMSQGVTLMSIAVLSGLRPIISNFCMMGSTVDCFSEMAMRSPDLA